MITNEVLDRRRYAARLQAVHICGSHGARKMRVLGERLECASAERIALDVACRREEDYG